MDCFISKLLVLELGMSFKPSPQIITDLGSIYVPECLRRSWETAEKNDCKKGSQSRPSLHLCSFLKTLVPFSVILKQTPGIASSFVGWISNAINPFQGLKRLCPSNCCQKQPEIEPFT